MSLWPVNCQSPTYARPLYSWPKYAIVGMYLPDVAVLPSRKGQYRPGRRRWRKYDEEFLLRQDKDFLEIVMIIVKSGILE